MSPAEVHQKNSLLLRLRNRFRQVLSTGATGLYLCICTTAIVPGAAFLILSTKVIGPALWSAEARAKLQPYEGPITAQRDESERPLGWRDKAWWTLLLTDTLVPCFGVAALLAAAVVSAAPSASFPG